MTNSSKNTPKPSRSKNHVRSPQAAVNPFAVEKPSRISRRKAGLHGSMKRAQSVIEKFKSEFRSDFSNWIASNWHIWKAFCSEVEVVWASGRRSYSARTIIEFIRHETAMSEVNGAYKINNSYVPDLGRLYGLMNKQRGSFFECRTMAKPIVRRVIRGRSTSVQMVAKKAAKKNDSRAAQSF